MCGVIGVIGINRVSHHILDGLGLLQHRGQDAAGISTLSNGRFHLCKDAGLVSSIFGKKELSSLIGNIGIGHVRYPTAGNSGATESQPFYVNSPYGIMFAHNGNITNVEALREKLFSWDRRHLNTDSDSEVLLNVFAHGLQELDGAKPTVESAFNAGRLINEHAKGGYTCVGMVVGLGLVAFRDPNGIRPLVLGKKVTDGAIEYMFASESVALDITGFSLVRDVAPGEVIVIDENREIHTKICTNNAQLSPCLFEYVYFARPDSILDGVSVYQSRINMGRKLGQRIAKVWADKQIDVVIPIPETGRVAAQEIASELKLPYREGFVKNRYVGRTFIMPNSSDRGNSVRRKLNAIAKEFEGKNVLLVDDSIVRGSTSKEIINMVRDLGAKSVHFASVSPEVKYPNVYGVDMPSRTELLAANRSLNEVEKWIGVDSLIFLSLEELKTSIQECNSDIEAFEDSVFTGKYVTGDVDDAYLAGLETAHAKRGEKASLEFGSDNLIANL